MFPKGLGDLKKLISKEKDVSSQIEEYKKILEKSPKNLDARLKLGDAYVKAGDKEAAIKTYTEAATMYADDGQLVKAIAVNKIIVRLDPSRKEAHDRLANLYFQRGVVAEPVTTETTPPKMITEPPKVLDLSKGDLPKLITAPQIQVPKASPADVALEKIPLLEGVDSADLDFLKKMAIFKDYKAGDTIVREGEKGNSLFIILEGSVKVFTKSKEGSPASLEPLGQGDFFGELAFLAHPYRQASVVASSACKILEIPESLLNPLLVKFPKVRTTLEEAQKTRDLRLTLARVPLFSDLNPEERLSIAKHLVLEEFLEGEVIFREGSQGGSLYIIQSGQVGISTTLMEDEEVSVIKKSAADQKELYLSTLEKGDFFGEASLLTNEPRSATATATAAKTELLKLSKIDLAEIVKQYPRIIPVLKKYHERRVQETLNALKSIL